jgi:uncharacterized protein YjiS (DUF1127 family)
VEPPLEWRSALTPSLNVAALLFKSAASARPISPLIRTKETPQMFTARLIDSFNTHRRRRRLVRELAALSDHQLKDIGVTRHDLFAPTRIR